MLTLPNTKILHIEPTDACNAACPQCARETDDSFNKKDIHHLTVAQFKKLITVEQIQNLDKAFMCGNYGDPAAGKYTLDLYRYIKSINPSITLGMNTNGSLQTKDWWRDLASIMDTPKDYVIWSIDGLEDTNHIYRVNTNWRKLIDNAKAFINNNGRAHWEMLVFKHNEHQVNEAQSLAKTLGFKWFRTKVSRRFESFPVAFLEKPTNVTHLTIESNNIVCQAITEKSLYISAKGIIQPCCWLGSTNYSINDFSNIQASWQTDTPNSICKSTCSTSDNNNNYSNQWKMEIEL